MSNFIGESFVDKKVCEDIIDFFNNSDYAEEWKILVNTTKNKRSQGKKAYNLSLPIKHDHPAILAYRKELNRCCMEYVKEYPYSNKYDAWDIVESVNIQYYKPGWSYSKFHTERQGCNLPYAHRHLVFMTYLNDVTDAGETEFYHQKIKYKPEVGKTLIWPADWTHTHRGIPSPTQDKYIITGWYEFIKITYDQIS